MIDITVICWICDGAKKIKVTEMPRLIGAKGMTYEINCSNCKGEGTVRLREAHDHE